MKTQAEAIDAMNQVRKEARLFSMKVTLLPLLVLGGLGFWLHSVFNNALFLAAGIVAAFLTTTLIISVFAKRKVDETAKK
ncbi:hypothetical protein FWH30_00140 [Microgenomates group bacterium]|nr:hypothetical protein [Microgenomates group bacterium]